MLSKNVNNKKCAPKLIFFYEKKIEKDSDNFWYRKLTLKVKRLGDFALFDTSPLIQFSKFNNFLWVCWFLGKNLSNFVPLVWKLHNRYCHNMYLYISCDKVISVFNFTMQKQELTILVKIWIIFVIIAKLTMCRRIKNWGSQKC